MTSLLNGTKLIERQGSTQIGQILPETSSFGTIPHEAFPPLTRLGFY